MSAFSGFGRHLSNDFLYEYPLHPATPSHIITSDPAKFERLETLIFQYLNRFREKQFLKRVATVPNDDNPFCFNENSNNAYMTSYVTVFRRMKTNVKSSLYLEYCKQGLFDSNHVIGSSMRTYITFPTF